MKKHSLWLIIIPVLLVACRGENGAPTNPTVSVDGLPISSAEIASDLGNGDIITIQFAVEDHELAVYRPLTEAFAAENPGIQIELLSTSQIVGNLSLDDNADAAGVLMAQSADVFSSHYLPAFNQSNSVRDLTPFMDADPSFDRGDFYPNSLQMVNGRIPVLPLAINFNLIFYNKHIFDAADVAYPQPDWTWDDFSTTAKQLTARDGGSVTQWGFVKSSSSWYSFFEMQLTSPLINSQTEPTTFRFEDADVTALAHQYEALFLIDQDALTFADTSVIDEGKAAMWSGHYSTPLGNDATASRGTVPFPATTLIGTNGLVMSVGSSHSEAAWKWMSFLSRQGQVGGGSFLPARISVAETTQFWQNVPPDLAETMRYALNNSRMFTPNPGYELFDDAMSTVMRGESTVEAAFSQAQRTAEQQIAAAAASDEELPPVVVDPIDAETNPEAISITFWLLNNDNIEGYRALATQFEADSNVRVEFRFPSGETIDHSGIAQVSDCYRWLYLLEDSYQSAAISLDPLIAADASFNLDDFFPAALDQFTAQGQLWGLPADLNPIIIEYNKDLFDAASASYPTADWTPDEFLNLAIALTTGEGNIKQYGFVSDVSELVLLKSMMARLEAIFIDDRLDPPTVAFTDQATMDAMRWYTNLSSEFGVKPRSQVDITKNIQNDYDQYVRLLREERVGMWTANSSPLPTELRETMNLGAVPLPVGSPKGNLEIPSSGYYISASSAHRQVCWEWIKLLTESVDVVSGVPARRSVAESAAFHQRVGEERAAAYLASMSRVSDTTNAEAYWWMFPSDLWLAQAHDQIVFDHLSVEEAMAAAQQTFDAYRACVIERDAFDSRAMQTRCAVEIDPTLAVILGQG